MRRFLFHLLLVAVALTWMPFGSRDPFGVSSVLPALHPVPPPSVAHDAAATGLRVLLPARDDIVPGGSSSTVDDLAPGPAGTAAARAAVTAASSTRPTRRTVGVGAAGLLVLAATIAIARRSTGRHPSRSRARPQLLLVGGDGCRAPPALL